MKYYRILLLLLLSVVSLGQFSDGQICKGGEVKAPALNPKFARRDSTNKDDKKGDAVHAKGKVGKEFENLKESGLECVPIPNFCGECQVKRSRIILQFTFDMTGSKVRLTYYGFSGKVAPDFLKNLKHVYESALYDMKLRFFSFYK